ncbi:SRPBCC family protein [Spirillospora sp. NBC_01491]|uniref:SRPBCC family protein n=1 Tax=Spirillospora sp. NBC_01491 TaxID=2976007 RepID=UPI002E313917|nr:SRPBCC family protein [Spirillospora sp. NBC_01491]
MQEIEVTARSAADPGAVYRLLLDGARWPECSPLGSFELERPGETEREGIGAIRVFTTGTVKSREQVVEAVPGRRFGYVLLSGLPLVGYRADLLLTPDGDGTVISWRSRFRPRYTGTGWFFRLFLGGVIRRLVAGLAATAGAPRT